MRYTEVKFVLKNEDVAIETTKNRIESNGNTVVKEFNFQKEKDNIKSDLLKQNKCSDSEQTKSTTTKYRKRR